MALFENLALIADATAGLELYDIDSEHPEWVGGYVFDAPAESLAVCDQGVVVAAGGDLHLINIEDPAKPSIVSSYSGPGYAVQVEAAGALVYVSEKSRRDEEGSIIGPSGLRIVDFNDLSAPRLLGGFDTNDRAHSLAVSGQLAYLTERSIWRGPGALHILDIGDPSNPKVIGTWTSIGDPSGVAVSGDFVYVAERPLTLTFEATEGGIHVVDVSDPSDPRLVSRFALTDGYTQGVERNSPRGAYNGKLAISGSSLLAIQANLTRSESWGALDVIDISDPADLRLAGRYSGFVQSLAVGADSAWLGEVFIVPQGHGHEFMGSRLQQIRIDTPANPQRIGQAPLDSGGGATNGYDIQNVAVSGDYRFTLVRASSNQFDPSGASNGGLEVIDESDPANPRPVAYYATFGIPKSVVISGNYAYLTELPHSILPRRAPGGLHVLDITDPTNPRRVGGNTAFFAIPNDFGGLTVSNGMIYLSLDAEDVAILPEYRPIRFDHLETTQGDERRFRIEGPPQVPGRLQRSHDLRTWTDWRSVMFGESPLSISDSDAPHPAAFYRFAAP